MIDQKATKHGKTLKGEFSPHWFLSLLYQFSRMNVKQIKDYDVRRFDNIREVRTHARWRRCDANRVRRGGGGNTRSSGGGHGEVLRSEGVERSDLEHWNRRVEHIEGFVSMWIGS